MKLSIFVCAAMLMMGAHSNAQQTVPEKTKEVGREAKRATKKDANRVQEPTCMQGDIKCEAVKEQSRVEEVQDESTDAKKKSK